MNQMVKPIIEKKPVSFSRMETALAAAGNKYPTDVLIAIGGNARHPSEYVFGEGQLREMLTERAFGTHPHDKVHIWLPA